MEEGHPKRPRGGREQTTEAILDAAEKLFSERGFTAVTVRDIAAEAGVSHALVHRYLGSKAEIYRAMLARNEGAIVDAASDQGELLTATSLMLREGLAHQRRYGAPDRPLGAARSLLRADGRQVRGHGATGRTRRGERLQGWGRP